MESAFPSILSAHDTALLAAEENRVYAMFRERRLRRTPAARALDVLGRGGVALMRVGVGTIVLVASVLLAVLVSEWFLILPLPALVLLARLGHGIALDDQRMPLRVTDVFSAAGYHPRAALDLWLAGVRGREVLEAIYLERAERWQRWAAVYTLAAALLLLRPFLHRGEVSATYAIFLAGGAYFLWRFAFLLYTVSCHMSIWRDATARLAAWRGEVRDPRGMAAMALRSALLGLALMLTVPCAISLLLPVPGSALALAFCGGVLALLGYIVGSYNDHYQDRLYAALQRELRRANEAFDMFICGTVVGDEAGRAWARWMHHPARLAHRNPSQPVVTGGVYTWQLPENAALGEGRADASIDLPTIRYEEG